MIKLVRGWRILRVGRGRAFRGIIVTIVLILVWHTILSATDGKKNANIQDDPGGGEKLPLPKLDDGDTAQVIAPALKKEVLSSKKPDLNRQVVVPPVPQPALEVLKEEKESWNAREEILRQSDNINPRYNMKAVKDKLQELQPKVPVRNQHFLHQNQNFLREDEKVFNNDDYDEDKIDNGGDDDGKWNGRNKIDNAEDMAIEEDDVPKDDVGLEDVGGEKLKKDKKEKDDEEEDDDDDNEEHRDKKDKHSKKKDKKAEKDDKHEKELDMVGERQLGDGDDIVPNNKLIDIDAIEQDLTHRKAKVREVCIKYGLGPYAPAGMKKAVKHPPVPNYDVYYIDRKHELAWCPIYKAASTSWLYNFLKLGGIEEEYIKNSKQQISHIARNVWPSLDYQDAERAFKTCLKFMVVRHPFERLVSAFRDKLENINIGREHGTEHFYKKFGKKIVAKFRPPGEGPPANRYSQDMDDPSIPAPQGIEPTFGEFVKYLIATDLVLYSDDHWMPYYLHCTPCLLEYDVIAKFETLERDQNYIIIKNHLEDKIKPTWKHLTKGIKTSDTIRKYFATITKKDLLDLYEKYKLDFELFDYSIDEYLKYVRHS